MATAWRGNFAASARTCWSLPQSDTLPLEIGGVDYRPVDEGAYLQEADLGKLKTIFWRHNILGFTPFLDVPAYVCGRPGARPRLIGTWYDHEVAVPDGTTFKTGVSVTHPWWKIQGRWFSDGANECVVGASLAAKHPGIIAIGKTIYVAQTEKSSDIRPLVVTGIVSTGDAEDDAILVPLSVAQGISESPGPIPAAFRERADETRRRFRGTRSEIADANGVRPLVLLALHFLDQLPDQAGLAGRRTFARFAAWRRPKGASSRA